MEINSDVCFSIKTYEALAAAGIPCTVVLDSAVAYVMDNVDFVLVGSEAVVESGGLINAVGSHQMAIIAKAANKPFYALAERLGLPAQQAGVNFFGGGAASLVKTGWIQLFELNPRLFLFVDRFNLDFGGIWQESADHHAGTVSASAIPM